MLQVKCLEYKINPDFHSLNASPSYQGFFGFYEMARVFKARINSYLNGPCSVSKSPGGKNKLKCNQENVGAMAEPPTRQTSVVFPTRVWKFLHFFS